MATVGSMTKVGPTHFCFLENRAIILQAALQSLAGSDYAVVRRPSFVGWRVETWFVKEKNDRVEKSS